MDSTIEVFEVGAAPAAVWDAVSYAVQNPLDAKAYGTPRSAALYSALDAREEDEEYSLVELADGRWALFGLNVEGHRFAVEASDR